MHAVRVGHEGERPSGLPLSPLRAPQYLGKCGKVETDVKTR